MYINCTKIGGKFLVPNQYSIYFKNSSFIWILEVTNSLINHANLFLLLSHKTSKLQFYHYRCKMFVLENKLTLALSYFDINLTKLVYKYYVELIRNILFLCGNSFFAEYRIFFYRFDLISYLSNFRDTV